MDAESIYLIILVCCLAIILLMAWGLFLIKFSHPDDKNIAKFPKLIVLSGLWLATASILVLPFDIANVRTDLRIDILWQGIYIVVALFVFGLIPYAYFFYESDTDPDERAGCLASQTGMALVYTLLCLIFFVIVTFVMYAFLGTAEIPFTSMTQNLQMVHAVSPDGILAELAGNAPGCVSNCFSSVRKWHIPVTAPVFLMAFIAFLGWFFFAVFAGVGLMALPMDLINEWRTRPMPMPTSEYVTEKQKLGERAVALLSAGESLKKTMDKKESTARTRAQKRKDRKNMMKFEQHFYFLKKDYEILQVAYQLKGGNSLWYLLKLFLGVNGLGLSLSWIIHIILFVLPDPPIHAFLNDLFIALARPFGSEGFALLGILAYSLWTMYLLWCCVKGNTKLGLRFIIWRVYPMEVHATLMNAFLVNTWLILLCAVPVVQFSVQSFPIYARFTEADMLFGSQIQYLQFFKYFWDYDIFIIALLGISFLTLIGLLVYPTDRAQQINDMLEEVKKKPDRV